MSEGHFSGTRDLLDRVSMGDLLSANGVRLPARGYRVKCPLCDSKSQPFSYNESKGCWHCFSCGHGGGKVAFISKLHNLTPKDSLAWIARLAGVELERWDRHEQQRYSAAMAQAKTKAYGLVEWRDRVIDELREQRDILQLVYWWVIRIDAHEHEAALWDRICDYDGRIQWHRDAPWEWLADVFDQVQQRKAA